VSTEPQSLVSLIAGGFSRRSVGMLILIFSTYASVGIGFPFLIDPTLKADWLLFGIWTVMTLAMTWDVAPSRDVKLILTGLVGGLVIEWWGTNTELWRYYTDERPPLWILPAWPIAALTIDRLGTLLDAAVPILRTWGKAYWVIMPLFVVAMTRFLWPSIHEPASWVVIGIMLAVMLWRPRTGKDLTLFVAGASLGIFLEYWGTSRQCWIYYSGQVPPPEAVFAHGFASVAFARGVQFLELPFTVGAPGASPAGES